MMGAPAMQGDPMEMWTDDLRLEINPREQRSQFVRTGLCKATIESDSRGRRDKGP